VTLPNYLKGFRILLLTYHGMKPLSPDVHRSLADWVRRGGVLVVCDDDTDPYNAVRDWWNGDGYHWRTPRQDLFAQLGLGSEPIDEGGRASSRAQASIGDRARADASALRPEGSPRILDVGKGGVIWMRENPAGLAASAEGDARLVATVRQAAGRARLNWRETNYLLLRRGPYVLGAGLDESVAGEPKVVRGRWVNLFDPELRVQKAVSLTPGARVFLLDLDAVGGRRPQVLASACKALPAKRGARSLLWTVEGVVGTPAVVLLRAASAPRSVTLAGQTLHEFAYSPEDRLLWIRFVNEARPRELAIEF
jgi:hypothetical protein